MAWDRKRILGKKRNDASENDWIEQSKTEQAAIRLDGSGDLPLQLAMIDLTVDDLKFMKALSSLVAPHLDEVTGAFYGTILKMPKLADIINRHSSVGRLKQTLHIHVQEMFEGVIDEAYVAKRLRIAQVHIRIGLETKWYMGAFQSLEHALYDIFKRYVRDPEQREAIRKTVGKVLNFEQQLVLEAYQRENMRLLEETYERVKNEIKSKIADASGEASDAVDHIADSLQELSDGSSEVNRSFEESVDKVRRTERWAMSGKEKLHELAKRVDQISESVEGVGDNLDQFVRSLASINQIVDLVQEIGSAAQQVSATVDSLYETTKNL